MGRAGDQGEGIGNEWIQQRINEKGKSRIKDTGWNVCNISKKGMEKIKEQSDIPKKRKALAEDKAKCSFDTQDRTSCAI